jgi:hypothetical protein
VQLANPRRLGRCVLSRSHGEQQERSVDLGAVRSQRWFTLSSPRPTALHATSRGAGQAPQAGSGSDGCSHLASPFACASPGVSHGECQSTVP